MSDLRVILPDPCDEPWEAMEPAGCHRACAKCDRVVHDLSQYDVAGIEKLLRDEPGSCVRASINAFGVVVTKTERHVSIRRILATVGAAGLLIGQPAMARNPRGYGVLVGSTLEFGQKTRVTATDDKGNSYRTRVKPNGRYKINHIPPGIYTVEFSSPNCGSWALPNVVVDAGEVVVANEAENDEYCVVVGLLKIDDNQG